MSGKKTYTIPYRCHLITDRELEIVAKSKEEALENFNSIKGIKTTKHVVLEYDISIDENKIEMLREPIFGKN